MYFVIKQGIGFICFEMVSHQPEDKKNGTLISWDKE